MLELIKKILKKAGFDLVEFTQTNIGRTVRLIISENIDLVFDVGANEGRFGQALRYGGYGGRIVSIEPVQLAYERLLKRSKRDKLWHCEHFALADKAGKSWINIAENTQSSSLLKMLPLHRQEAPTSHYISRERVIVQKLDQCLDDYAQKGDKICLKMDTQGAEKMILVGAKKSLRKISIIHVEMSLVPLYEGEALMPEMIRHMSRLGFELVAISPVFWSRDGCLLQADGTFIRI